MSLARKLNMARTSCRLGRGVRDKLELLRLCAKHGGLLPFRGDQHVVGVNLHASNAPRLHFRDSSSDGILFVEVLVEEDYAALRQFELKPRTIFDIGANIGFGSCFLRMLYPEARLIGFEPSAAESAVLKLNYAAWGNCEHVAVAVGDQHDVSVTFAVHPDKTGGQHVASSTNESDWHHVQVLMQRIDRLIESGAVPLPDLVKMDIEGGEISALTGFGNHLSAPQAYVLETHSETLHRQCIEMLSEAGYWVASDTPRPGEARILCMIKS